MSVGNVTIVGVHVIHLASTQTTKLQHHAQSPRPCWPPPASRRLSKSRQRCALYGLRPWRAHTTATLVSAASMGTRLRKPRSRSCAATTARLYKARAICETASIIYEGLSPAVHPLPPGRVVWFCFFSGVAQHIANRSRAPFTSEVHGDSCVTQGDTSITHWLHTGDSR